MSKSKEELQRIQDLCDDNISAELVSEREGPGKIKLSFIEGYRIIDRMNIIFGSTGWSNEMIELHEKFLDKEPDGHYVCTYTSTQRVDIEGLNSHTGSGTGHGKSRKKGEAIESAMKEAETDAIKRACIKFGKSLGLALYDKEKSDVGESRFNNDGTAKEGMMPARFILDAISNISSAEEVNQMRRRLEEIASRQTFTVGESKRLKAAMAAKKLQFGVT